MASACSLGRHRCATASRKVIIEDKPRAGSASVVTTIMTVRQLGDPGEPAQESTEKLEREVRQIRMIFFELFVEALVPTIRGEKLIWMLETTPMGQRLYELGLVERKPKDGAKDADAVEDEDDDAGSDEADDDT